VIRASRAREAQQESKGLQVKPVQLVLEALWVTLGQLVHPAQLEPLDKPDNQEDQASRENAAHQDH
jgi:hypothetical protein